MKEIADKMTFECCSFRLRIQNYHWSSMDPVIWVHLKAFVYPVVTTLLYLNTAKKTTWDTTGTTLLSNSIGNWPKSMHSDHFLSLLNSSLQMTILCSWTRAFKYCSYEIPIGSSNISCSDICNVILLA